MIIVQGKSVEAVYHGAKEIAEVYRNGKVIFEAGNFRTADGMILQTSDKKIFNVKIKE